MPFHVDTPLPTVLSRSEGTWELVGLNKFVLSEFHRRRPTRPSERLVPSVRQESGEACPKAC